MPLGGGRTIIILRTADRDRGRRRGCQRSWEVTCHHFIPVPSLCRWRNVGHDRLLWWRARLAYFSQWSGQTYPDRIWRSSRCDMTIIRMCYLRVSCTSPCSWGNPDWVIRMRIRTTCHQKNVCHVASGEGPYICGSSRTNNIHVGREMTKLEWSALISLLMLNIFSKSTENELRFQEAYW